MEATYPRLLWQTAEIGNPPPSHTQRHVSSYKRATAPSFIPDAVLAGERDILSSRMDDDIDSHALYKVQMFLQQLVFVDRTGLECIFNEKAYLQVGAPRFLPKEARDAKGSGLQAAHSATITSLTVCIPGDKKQKLVGYQGKNRATILQNENSTALLPSEINRADLKIEREKYQATDHYSLRWHATVLLNNAAQGKTSPKDTLYSFLDAANKIAQEALATTESPEQKYVLNRYINVFSNCKQELSSHWKAFLISQLHMHQYSQHSEDEIWLKAQKNSHDLFTSEMGTPQDPPPTPRDPAVLPLTPNKILYYQSYVRPLTDEKTQIPDLETVRQQLLKNAHGGMTAERKKQLIEIILNALKTKNTTFATPQQPSINHNGKRLIDTPPDLLKQQTQTNQSDRS